MGKLIGSLVVLGLVIYLVAAYFHQDKPETEQQPAESQYPEVFELKDNLGHVNIRKNYFSLPTKVSVEDDIKIPKENPYEFYSKEIEKKEKP